MSIFFDKKITLKDKQQFIRKVYLGYELLFLLKMILKKAFQK
jgi:hypothetical protein